MADKSAREITSEEFEAVLSEKRVVLADFFATWCGPCKAMEPILERLAERFAGRAAVIKVNIDNSPDLAGKYGVLGVPTFLLFIDSQPVNRVVGTSSERALTALIEARLDEVRGTAA
jgi:thioredoxin 1